MILEQSLYQIPLEKPVVYQIGDLESLSAVVLGYGTGPKLPLEKGFGKGPSLLRIKDLSDGSSLHVHEVKGKITGANIRGKGEKKGYPLSNYEAMMLEILQGKITIKKKKKS